MITDSQLKRIEKVWSEFAREDLKVQAYENGVYTLCSELAALRLYYQYSKISLIDDYECGESDNLNSWYFSLKISL